MPLIRKPDASTSRRAPSKLAASKGAPIKRQGRQPEGEPAEEHPDVQTPIDDAVPPPTQFGSEHSVAPPKRPEEPVQLEEVVGRGLVTADSRMPENVVQYSPSEKAYVRTAAADPVMQLLHFQGSIEVAPQNPADDSAALAQGCKRGAAPGKPLTAGAAEPQRLHNGFTSIDRAVQTVQLPPRDRGTGCEPRSVAAAAGECSPYIIHDAYLAAAPATQPPCDRTCSADQRQSNSSASRERAVRVLERIIHQNINSEIAADCEYWDDPADQARPGEGTLLPLWHFVTAAARGRAVTALTWSPRHWDLFAAGYGSFDPGHPLTGLLCCHSLKDPSRPEFQLALPAGVLSLDFHPAAPRLLAVGCQDGSVHVVDVSVPPGAPLPAVRASSLIADRHADAVWQVKWAPQAIGGAGEALRFCSASSDGQFVQWELGPGRDLRRSALLALEGAAQHAQHDVGDTAGVPFGCCCFDMHPAQPTALVVGTQEGDAVKCSTDCPAEFAEVFRGHAGPVYSVQWSPFHPRVFLTAGADWSLRLWDSWQPAAEVMCFGLGAPVGDAAWAPFSPTVLAAATEGGRVHVFDLSQNPNRALCAQKVAQKAKLTKLAFSPSRPILIVGDDKGEVLCMKLSPNLRKLPAQQNLVDVAGQAQSTSSAAQITQPQQPLPFAESKPGNDMASRLDSVLELAARCKLAEVTPVLAAQQRQPAAARRQPC